MGKTKKAGQVFCASEKALSPAIFSALTSLARNDIKKKDDFSESRSHMGGILPNCSGGNNIVQSHIGSAHQTTDPIRI
jgi:hypothetical protein